MTHLPSSRRFARALRTTTTVLAASLAGLALTACAPPEAKDETALRYGVTSEVKTIDPSFTTALIDFRLIDCAFEPLVKIDPATGEVKPGCATWEVSEDKLVYTFTIREDAKWSNGDAVTAEDFAYGWQRAIWPEFATAYTSLFDHIKGVKTFRDFRRGQFEEYARLTDGKPNAERAEMMLDIAEDLWNNDVGIKVVDARTLEVTLERPTNYFIELCAFGTFMPVHKASLMEAGNESLNPANGQLRRDLSYFTDPDQVICNGPYVVTQWQADGVVQMDQNPQYWNRDAMGNRRIVQRYIKDPGSLVRLFEAGELDWIPQLDTSTSKGVEMLQQRRDGERNDVDVIQAAGTYYYRFNSLPIVAGAPNPFADGRVGLALTLCLDRREIVENLSRGGEQPVTTIVPDCIPGYTPPADEGLMLDPDRARRLMTEAGFPNGEGFPRITFLYNSDSPVHERIAQRAVESWKQELGITVDLEGMIFQQLLDRTQNGNFFIARAGWYGDYRDPTTWLDMFRTGDGNNDGEYSDPRYDALLVSASNEPDPAARFALLEEAETMLIQAGALCPIFRYTTVHLYDPDRVENLNPNTWNYFELDQVIVTPKDAG